MLNKVQKYLIPLLGATALLINLIAYKFLPEKIGMQINTAGELKNYIAKPIFVIIAPVVMVGMYLISNGNDEENRSKYLMVSIIVFILNIVSIFFNI